MTHHPSRRGQTDLATQARIRSLYAEVRSQIRARLALTSKDPQP